VTIPSLEEARALYVGLTFAACRVARSAGAAIGRASARNAAEP